MQAGRLRSQGGLHVANLPRRFDPAIGYDSTSWFGKRNRRSQGRVPRVRENPLISSHLLQSLFPLFPPVRWLRE